MSRRTLATAIVALAAFASPAIAATPTQSGSVTATGTAQTKVKPKNRHSNRSIVAAVQAAQKAGIPRAIADAKEYAEEYAAAAGLTLGSIIGVSDTVAQNGPPFGVGFAGGYFGPNKYCGTIQQVHVKIVIRNGRKVPKVIRGKKVHRCFVPSTVSTTLAVTWSAS